MWPPGDRSDAERFAAAAGAVCVGVLEYEPFAFQALFEIELDAFQVYRGFTIHVKGDAVPFDHVVALSQPVKIQDVGQSGTPPAFDGQTDPGDVFRFVFD